MSYVKEMLTNATNFEEFLKTIKQLDDYEIVDFLESKEYKKHKIENEKLVQILCCLSDDGKLKLNIKEIRKVFRLKDEQINIIINSIESEIKKQILLEKDEEKKLELIKKCELKESVLDALSKDLSDKNKIKLIIEKDIDDAHLITNILLYIKKIEYVVNFCAEYKRFLERKNVNLYSIVQKLDNENQLKFLKEVEKGKIKVTEREKMQILASLTRQNKEKLKLKYKKSEMPEIYQKAFSVDVNIKGIINVDFTRNLEDYRDFDEMIRINVLDLSKEEKIKLEELCGICKKMLIAQDKLGTLFPRYCTTGKNYKETQIWIKEVLSKIKKDWSDAQKILFIDNQIGKRVSYSLDEHTEDFDKGKASNFLTVVSEGYGVCMAIAQLEQYMLKLERIDAEVIHSSNHAFVKVKNIKITTKEGEVKIGDTIVDPTWNLADSFFDAYPRYIFRSYKKIREMDVNNDGTDSMAHKNDQQLESANIEIDKYTLKDLSESIGLLKGGHYPLKSLYEKILKIDKEYSGTKNIQCKLKVLEEIYPQFPQHAYESIELLKDIISSKLEFKECIIDRVYEKDDNMKIPVMFIYVDYPKEGRLYYYCKRDDKGFSKIDEEEFKRRFECYKEDYSRLMIFESKKEQKEKTMIGDEK